MTISIASAREMAALSAKTLELDDEVIALLSPEGLSASLRRAASFLCPATPRQLVDAVIDAVRPLGEGGEPSRGDLMDLLDLLVSTGDLLELRQAESRSTRLLFLGPPSYVEREPGRYLVAGVRPFGASLVGASLGGEILYREHTRTVELDPSTAAAQLSILGLHKVSRERWVAAPASVPAANFVDQLRQRVDAGGHAGEIEGLTIVGTAVGPRNYHARWRTLKATDTGYFVARRPQAYGADLWCFIHAVDGLPQRLIDFPVENPTVPGRDEAWRLQAAIDATLDQPHVFRRRSVAGTGSDVVVDFFGPLPGWAERYLQVVGSAVQRSVGSLFSYLVPDGAILDLEKFLTDMLWMRAAREGGPE